MFQPKSGATAMPILVETLAGGRCGGDFQLQSVGYSLNSGEPEGAIDLANADCVV
jgi:hypothetical protein